MNCLGREYAPAPPESAHGKMPPAGAGMAQALHMPISRAQLLKTIGGGAALGLTGGPLIRMMTQHASEPLPHLVLIVLDGARPEYFDVPDIPHVRDLIRKGTQYTNAFAGILESETPSGHVSIATGSEPRHTGIPSFWWADSDNNEVSLFDPDKIRAGAMESIVREAGVPTLAHLVHRKSRRAKVVALSGSKYYAADAIGGPDSNVTMYFQGDAKGRFVPTYIPGHAPPAGLLNSRGLTYKSTRMPLGAENHLAMQLAINTFKRMRQQVTLINLPEFDWPLGHVDGGVIDPSGARTMMRAFDRDLAAMQEAYRKAGVLDRTIFVLMADHGMMPLHHRLPDTDFSAAVEKAGTTLVTQAYSSAAYLWVKDSRRAVQAARNIASLDNHLIQSVYARVKTSKGYVYRRVTSSKQFRTHGAEYANQYLLNSFNGSNAPDIAVLFTEGAGCEPGGQSGWKADHGGTSWEAQHLPLILSGYGIRSGVVSSYPARLIDVAPTVLQVMDVTPRGMQGLPLADAMAHPPGWAAQRQKATAKQLMPVVAALQHESKLELKAA